MQRAWCDTSAGSPSPWLLMADAQRPAWRGQTWQLVYIAGRLLRWQEQHKRGLGWRVGGFPCPLSLVFSFGIMGQGALILSGLFRLSSLVPMKGIEVSRAIMTLETKDALLSLCRALEIHYVPGIVCSLPMETAEMRLVVPPGVTRDNPMSSRRIWCAKGNQNKILSLKSNYIS